MHSCIRSCALRVRLSLPLCLLLLLCVLYPLSHTGVHAKPTPTTKPVPIVSSTGGGGTDIFSTQGSVQGPAAWISTNSSCPYPSLVNPDVFLDVPKLEVDQLSLYVEHLRAQVSVTASLSKLLTIHVGVEAEVSKVNLTLKGVRAQLRLEARLDTIASMINRTLSSVEQNPELLTSLLASAAATAQSLASKSQLAVYSIPAGTVIHTLDSFGRVTQRVLDPLTGAVRSQSIVGSYETMELVGGPQPLPDGSGSYVQQYRYLPFGTLVDVTFNEAGQVLDAVVHEVTA